MTPTTVIGLLLIAAAIALAAQDAYWRKREKCKADDASADLAAEQDQRDAAVDHWRHLYREVYGCWERSQEDELDALAEVSRLTDELGWARLTIAVQAADADMRREMLGANVVPLRRGGAS